MLLADTIMDYKGKVKSTVAGDDWTTTVDRLLADVGGRTDAEASIFLDVSESTIRRWREMRRDGKRITGETRGRVRQALMRAMTPEGRASAQGRQPGRGETVRGGGYTEDASEDTSYLSLPDVSFLAPRAQAVFDETIGSYVRRGWTSEAIETAAELLIGYFKRTSTLQSSGASLPELSEAMQLHVLRESREEIEIAFDRLGRGSRR